MVWLLLFYLQPGTLFYYICWCMVCLYFRVAWYASPCNILCAFAIFFKNMFVSVYNVSFHISVSMTLDTTSCFSMTHAVP